MARSQKKHEAVASASDSSVKAPAQAATVSGNEFTEFIETARRTEDEALSGFIEPFKDRLTDVAVELVQGEPENAIARFVESHGIDVVVMGTVARTGIAGLLMGNTAERVLQRLRGSVLAVKPPGFRSPVAET